MIVLLVVSLLCFHAMMCLPWNVISLLAVCFKQFANAISIASSYPSRSLFKFVLSFASAMDIKLGVQHFVSSDLTGKSWNIPITCIQEDADSKLWLKVSPSNFGLCNLLTTERLDPKKRPTLKMSEGLNYLLGERNVKVFEKPKDPLFDGEEPPKKKLKKQNQPPPDADGPPLYIDVGDEGAQVIVKPCKKSTDDLVILYEEQNVNVFTSFLQQSLNITFEGSGSKRAYNRSGKYSKKDTDAKGESPEQDD